ncbi:M1 family metallopeptidase [Granulicella sp. WH15]|uniref:M1 family metallopeptidase n=1 Tax=Granulicella sp. WH15 TaxID=2602070 RepID=UPI00136725A5|nr:M1 family metallopeptidase [Granulicella sp. WH15]QHN02670.1 M1 family metallopeptidase [Granulicella sp. WH15]
MFGQVFLFELKQRLKSPVIWVLAALLAIKTISDMLGGEWQGLAGGGVPRNAPFAIYYVCVYATFWTVVFGAGLMTAPLLRDAQTRMAPLVNSSRVTSGGYFWGKFLASLIGLLVVMLGIVVGIALVPTVEQVFHLVPAMQLMPTPWAHVFVAWMVWILPGCIIYGSIHFALAAFTGRTLPSYGLAVLSMAVFTLFFVAFSGVTGSRLFWLEVLDPMGHHTATAQLSLWTVAERSHRFLQPQLGLVLNRALYLGGALVLLLIARWRFSLPALVAKVKSPSGVKKRPNNAGAEAAHYSLNERVVPVVTSSTAQFRSLRVAWYLALRELKITWTGTAFRIVIGAVVLLGFLGARFGSADYYTQPEQHLLPAAQYLLELVDKQMFLMLVMVGIYFGSEMLARDRTARMAMLVDTAPVSTNTLAGARWMGVTLLSLTLAPLAPLTVFLFQSVNGYWELFPAHFLRSFLQMAPQVIVFSWLAMFLYSLTRSKVASQSISILLLLFFAILHSINAIEQHFFVLGLPVDLVFSDFRVMAASNARHLSFDAWYFGIAGALAVFAAWLWPRGTETSLSKRLSASRYTISWSSLVLLMLALISLAGGGINAWREIHVRHLYRSVKQERQDASTYETRYSGDRIWPQPSIRKLTLQVAIDPDAKRMSYEGEWRLSNQGTQPINRLHIEMPEDADSLELSAQDASIERQFSDEIHRVGIWQLSPALLPGHTLNLHVRSGVRFHGFEEKPFEGTVGEDTAWFRTNFLPHFGYDATREIDSPTHRTEYGLGIRRDREVRNNVLAVNDNAGWIDLDLSVSTPAGWNVVANGTRGGEVADRGKQTTHFEARHVPLALQVVAGKLATHVETLTSQDGRKILLTFAYHPNHAENVARMATILRSAFTEWERRFGPCPSGFISLAEIPQYQEDGEPERLTPTTSASGIIVMPERLGWLHNYRTEPARDWLTFILGQELARTWWGTQLASREGPGSSLVDNGVPMLLGLTMIEKMHGTKAADDYASLLTDRLREEMAREAGVPASILTTNFEDYAGMQAGLELYDRRRKVGSSQFDRLLDQAWKMNVLGTAVSPNAFAGGLGLSQ